MVSMVLDLLVEREQYMADEFQGGRPRPRKEHPPNEADFSHGNPFRKPDRVWRSRHWIAVAAFALGVIGIGALLFQAVVSDTQSVSFRPSMPANRGVPPPTRTVLQAEKVDEAWLKQVAAFPAEEQVEAVTLKLKELNPDFDGKVDSKIDNGVVTEFSFFTDKVTDISPVRGLAGLKRLSCNGTMAGEQKLSDLSPLRGLSLTELDCCQSKVSDLSPLKGMPLWSLLCGDTKVSDLSPLKGMKLTRLFCWNTPVSDLSPLQGMPLTDLACGGTPVSDLSPLIGMPLTTLYCYNTKVSDLSPLTKILLTKLSCYDTPVSDLSPLKGMPLDEL